MNVKEQFKEIVDFPNYEVSNQGNVRRIGSSINRKTQEQYKGYIVISIKGSMNIRKTVKIHRLVAIAFIPNPDFDKFNMINHIDGDKSNNNVENLEWCDNSMNQKHAFTHNLQTNIGSNNPRSIITEDDVRCIRANKYNRSLKELSIEYNLSLSGLKKIYYKYTWKHID